MRRLSLAAAFVLFVVGCAAPAPVAVPSASPAATEGPELAAAADANLCPDGTHSVPTRFRDRGDFMLDANGCQLPRPTPGPQIQIPQVPMPEVALRTGAFSSSAPPVAQRVAVSEFLGYATSGFGLDLMNFLDRARGIGPYGSAKGGPMSDDEWNSRIWPGAFQQIARGVTTAKPAQGRFFHFESLKIDAAYALPWNLALPNMPGVPSKGLQFIDVTIQFRDHAETPPAEGELWYTWHLRLPTSGTSVFAIADGYDSANARSWMGTAPYWTRTRLEDEAKSAVAGYLWNESYIAGGYEQFANGRDTTPFWHDRITALNGLNALFRAGRLTERRFEGVTVRVDDFAPMTVFGGGVVTATIAGRVVEALDGKTRTVSFTQPTKFFRFGANPVALSGWVAVDAEQDGEWVSGGDLALDKLETAHG